MTSIQRQIQTFGQVVCTWDLKTCAAVGQISRNAVDHRGFSKQHLCSLLHSCAGNFASLLHINLLKCCIKLGRKNWHLFNLNRCERSTLEQTSLIIRPMEKAAIEWQAALRGNWATVSISDGADRHSVTVSRFAQFHTGAKRIEVYHRQRPVVRRRWLRVRYPPETGNTPWRIIGFTRCSPAIASRGHHKSLPVTMIRKLFKWPSNCLLVATLRCATVRASSAGLSRQTNGAGHVSILDGLATPAAWRCRRRCAEPRLIRGLQ